MTSNKAEEFITKYGLLYTALLAHISEPCLSKINLYLKYIPEKIGLKFQNHLIRKISEVFFSAQ